MSTIDELDDTQALNQNADLFGAGLHDLTEDGDIVFDRYTKFILPVDGFVFWIRSGDVSVNGSLHISIDKQQNEDETVSYNRVVFNTLSEVQAFNDISPTVMYVAKRLGVRFAFSRRDMFFETSGVYHYSGTAIVPQMETQLVDDILSFDEASAVVSNSMPIWLSINNGTAIPGIAVNNFPLVYPSFAVPENNPPPYISAHVEPGSTEPIQQLPGFANSTLTHYQLVKETVRFTLYGMRNNEALDFQDYVNIYSLFSNSYGIMNMPVMKDEKRTQPEMGILAQKKTFTVDVNYYQSRASDIARQLILTAIVTFKPSY